MPLELDKSLRDKAEQGGLSLNGIAVEPLARAAGIGPAIVLNHELDFAIGTWIKDEQFDNAIEDQRRIDSDLLT